MANLTQTDSGIHHYYEICNLVRFREQLAFKNSNKARLEPTAANLILFLGLVLTPSHARAKCM